MIQVKYGLLVLCFGGCEELTTIYASNKFVTTSMTSSSDNVFKDCNSLVGGNGSTLSSIYAINRYGYTNSSYARIDTPSTPGYFTLKTN